MIETPADLRSQLRDLGEQVTVMWMQSPRKGCKRNMKEARERLNPYYSILELDTSAARPIS
jgi:hypothetical protein